MALVAALAGACTAGRHAAGSVTTSRSSTSHTVQPSNPADGLRGEWHLIKLEGFEGRPSTLPDVPNLTFEFHNKISPGSAYPVYSDGNTAAVAIEPDALVFRQGWINNLTTPGPHLGYAQSNWVFVRLLTGSVTWSITNGVLTIGQRGVGTLLMRR